MGKISKPSQTVADKLVFHDKKALFAGWRDKDSATVFTQEDFTLDKVGSKLCAISGRKRKAQMKVLGNGASVNRVDAKPAKSAKTTGSALGKRKSTPAPTQENTDIMSCFYCAGVHNDIQRGLSVDGVSVNACNAVHMNSSTRPVPSASPPNRMEFLPSPVRDQIMFDAHETVDLMDVVMSIGFNGGDSWVLDSGCRFGLTDEESNGSHIIPSSDNYHISGREE
ncbi:uncharacterized protein PITG_15574 [Phytophthora infestans T30-4]|uniref:Uncharacterized protein n=1 Tax=Phytophthora infestans (strain T30-4) TaxID=403677 RepID=D0NT39_PHYIT|nr:uncharacterized protein PITG_15574 [Phytophthora infestans T30-4]EEY64795.1 hypothetical protein PITG_15574 [Phytophthora infestans T30-4]|eukprot:XP_002897722.1 hypothetical protein PITG_15574 [Phytophthora infestans T30-4]